MYLIHYVVSTTEGDSVLYLNGGLQLIETIIRQDANIIKIVDVQTDIDVTERIRDNFIQPLKLLTDDPD